MMDKSITPSMNDGFRDCYGNWNQVGNGGVMSAALALYEKDKRKCSSNIERASSTTRRCLQR